MLKRCFDVVLSAYSLLLLMPFLAILALLIRLTSPGPAIFRQQRTGRHLRPFSLYKFRTMADGVRGPAFTLDLDPRVTPIGRWLRRTKLDEIPQLWNILRGEMSFVGPRPIMPELIDPQSVAYRQLYSVRPGLTDPASVKYANEAFLLQHVENPERYFLEVLAPDKLRISLEYQRTASLATDLQLIAQTMLVCHRTIMQSPSLPSTHWLRQRIRGTVAEQP